MTAHAAGAAAVRAVLGVEYQPDTPSLPVPSTRLITMTEAELYDLTYHATTRYLGQLSGMTKHRAHHHAGRLAGTALADALASDYVHEGADPRA